MCKENTVIWKKQSKIRKLQCFMKDLNLFIKQCYCIVWMTEKKQSKNLKVAKINKGKPMLLF